MGGLTKSALNRLERALDLDEKPTLDEKRTFVKIDIADSDADWLAQFSEEPDRVSEEPDRALSGAPPVTAFPVAPPAFNDPALDIFSPETDIFSSETDRGFSRPEETTEAVTPERLEPEKTSRWLQAVVVIVILGAVAGSLIGLLGSIGMLGARFRGQSPAASNVSGTPDPITQPPITSPASGAPTPAPRESPALAQSLTAPPPPPIIQDRTAKPPSGDVSNPRTDSVVLRSPSSQPTPSTQTTSTQTTGPVGPPATAPELPTTSLTTLLPTGSIPGPPPAEPTPPSRTAPAFVQPALSPPPPPPPPPLSEPPKSVSENSAIYMVLGRYQSAFNDLNATVAKSVWPSVDERALARAFDRLEHQEVVFDLCQIEVAGARAVASCRGRAQYVPKVGNKSTRLEPHHWTFRLSSAGDGWVIDSVESR